MIQKLIGEALEAAEFSYKSQWACRVVSFEDGCGAFVCIVDVGDKLIVAFRGTDAANDWLKNLRAYPWRYNGVWVHRGFMTAHQRIWPQVYAELQRRGGTKPILLVGHSYGGALAELSCMFLRDYPAGVSLVTFGKPNVFAKPRKARFGYLKAQVSVVHGSDLVARVPWIMFGPDLGQTMLYFANSDESLWIPPGDMAAATCEYLEEDWSWREGTITDHLLPAYRRRFDQFLRESVP